MGITKIVNYNFALDLFEKGSIPPIYSSVQNDRIEQQEVNNLHLSDESMFSGITEVKCIPEFLTPLPRSLGKPLKLLQIQRFNGYYIDLSGFSSVDEYIMSKMGSKRKLTRLKRPLKRLESCFDINYEVYFGEIEQGNYEYLFNTMQQFIKQRFEQRGDEFDPTINLDEMRKKTYSMILEKKASLHVIYNQSDPIDICLNYHYQDVLNSAISSYDINYSKFGLGNIDIMKHLEWCIDNNYQVFDFMWGDLPYKHVWSNKVYRYGHHIFYDPKSVIHRVLVPIRVLLYKFKDYWKSKKERGKKNVKSRIGTEKSDTKPRIEQQEVNHDEINGLAFTEINIHLEPNLWLRPLVYDFQYRYVEHAKNIKVLKLCDKQETYAVIGKTKAISIVNHLN